MNVLKELRELRDCLGRLRLVQGDGGRMEIDASVEWRMMWDKIPAIADRMDGIEKVLQEQSLPVYQWVLDMMKGKE